LTTCVEGLRLIKQVDNPHVRLLFDIYHEQVQTGNVIETIREAANYTEIFHVADSPGRHEPGTGELYYPNIYKAIAETEYRGYVTMEYLPTLEAARSLIQSVDEMRAAFAEAG
jgi:hydroxypyruvate isomerase